MLKHQLNFCERVRRHPFPPLAEIVGFGRQRKRAAFIALLYCPRFSQILKSRSSVRFRIQFAFYLIKHGRTNS